MALHTGKVACSVCAGTGETYNRTGVCEWCNGRGWEVTLFDD